MSVLAALTCSATLNPNTDHQVDTRSGEATCCVCMATHILEPAELLALLEDA
jgi:hypothetical protein